MTISHPISPLDDRYKDQLAGISIYFSEFYLMKIRYQLELKYLLALSQESLLEFPILTSIQNTALSFLIEQFDGNDFETIKQFERETHHDVKAVEYLIRRKFHDSQLDALIPWIHFALTSEDINNLSYLLMWKYALETQFLPTIQALNQQLYEFSQKYADSPILALTHGQPATPTTLGKEIAVFYHRIQRQIIKLEMHRFEGKFSGATGTWSAHNIAYPQVDWLKFSEKFLSSLELDTCFVCTQVNSYDTLVESYQTIERFNTILIDLARDMWMYISRKLLGSVVVAGEVGSSTMPHKVNPIYFENAEGNLLWANGLFKTLADHLPISRMQRDLSGSTLIRNQGVALGHSFLACKSLIAGFLRIQFNSEIALHELNNQWDVLTEAIQSILRKHSIPNAYEQLKEFSRGQCLTLESIQEFIKSLDVPQVDKDMLLQLTPAKYTGLAEKLCQMAK